MNLNWKAIAAAVVVAAIVALLVGHQWESGYRFHEAVLDGEKGVLQNLQKRVTLNVNTTSQDGLLGVVGLVLIVDKAKAAAGPLAFDRSNVIPDYRPPGEAILVSPVNKTLYQGKVSNSLDAGGSYTAFTADLKKNQTAELVIADELYLGYRDRAKIPYQKLHELKPPEGKEYYFVEGATVSSTTYRTFDEVGSTGTLEGTAFKANGKVYASGTGFAYTQTVAVDTFSVQALQPSAAAPADPGTKKIISLYQQHKIGELSPQGADELIGLLKEKSGDVAVLRGAELKGSVH